MNTAYGAILLSSVLQFILGAIWYGPLFGKKWMKITDCDHLSKEELQKAEKEMGPFYATQLVLTLITTFVLWKLIVLLPLVSPFTLVCWIWLGFVMPTQVSSVIWGGDEKKWFMQKIAISSGASLVGLLLSAAVFTLW